jgi:hypothetical protein
LWFILFGGSGVLIGIKLESIHLTLLVGLGVAAWFYALIMASIAWAVSNSALVIDSLKIVVPIAVLETLALAWLLRKKLAPDRKMLNAFFDLAVFTLLIITPFTIGGVLDYNWRGDSSPPRLIQLTVVAKWKDYDSDEGEYMYYLKGETLDGSRWFSFWVIEDFYNEHEIGSRCEITVRNGALGYEWLDHSFMFD